MRSPQRLLRIEHAQLAMPAGAEDEARRFYAGVLGLDEAPKPAELAGRGGCWFEQGEGNRAVKLHLGWKPTFARPARPTSPLWSMRLLPCSPPLGRPGAR